MTILDDLVADDFLAQALAIASAEGLRSFMRGREEVNQFRRALDSGELSEDEVRRFVSDLLAGFCRNIRFAEEPALAAIAVALEDLPSSFAQEYLRDLSELRASELPLAPRVAVLANATRSELVSGITERIEVFSQPLPFSGGTPRLYSPDPIDADSKYEIQRLAS